MMLNRRQCLNYTWCHRKYIVSLSHKHIHHSCILYVRRPSSARKTVSSIPNTLKVVDSGLYQTQKAVCSGIMNFYGVEGDEGVIYADEIHNSKQLIQDSMKNLLPKPNSEFKAISFGAVRLDSENKPSYYARYSTGVEQPELADGNENNNLDQNLSENTSKSVTEVMTSKTQSVKNLTDNVNCVSPTEQNLSSSLSDIQKYFPMNNMFPEIEELKSETSVPDLLKNSSETKLNNAYTFEENQADSCDAQKSNFIDSLYFANVKESENTLRDGEDVFESKNIISKNDISPKRNFNTSLQNEHQQNKINLDEKSSNFIDEQYFPKVVAKDLPTNQTQSKLYNYIDEQYFSDIDSNKSNKSHIVENESDNDLILKYNNKIEHCVDKPDFPLENSEIHAMHISEEICKNEFSRFQSPTRDNEKFKIEIPRNDPSIPDSTPIASNKNSLNSEKIVKPAVNKTELHSSSSSSKVQPETAYDFVKSLKEEQTLSDEVKRGISAKKEKKVDSKGFRILKHQVPSLMYYTRDEMLELLKKNILFIDEDIVILNKPYNLIIHESNTTKNQSCLSRYLNDFAQLIGEQNKSQELFTVHRLDKETTGCLLLARNIETAQRMKSLFAQRKIIKTYWIVTSKVPDPMEGVIDIPISEGKIGDRARMVLHPDLPSDTPYVNRSKCGKRAVTFYKVIATSGNAALVEVKPETGIKHQIRVHFGFGLACPIIGDHKYSYLDKLVPQKLPSDLLQKLHVRQSKVRHIPLHIHSKHLLIPQYANQRNLYVTAPLPYHMSENLRFLKFKKK